MVLVAVAGGTSPTLGRSIVTAIKDSGNHEVVILSRIKRGCKHAMTSSYGAQIRRVDYDSSESLEQGLCDVHTLISIIRPKDLGQMVTNHQHMIKAAKVAGVKRFAPSSFGMGLLAKQKVDLTIWESCQQSGLECTRFCPGIFMNYLGQGCPARSREEAMAGLHDDSLLSLIDIGAGRALVPVTTQGQPARISMCELGDVGRFVAAALDLDQWEDEFGMVGSTTTMEEIVWMAERLGRLMKTDTLTKAQAQQRVAAFDLQLQKRFTEEAVKGRMVAQVLECLCDGLPEVAVVKPTLNFLCPQIEPMGFDEYLARYWRGPLVA